MKLSSLLLSSAAVLVAGSAFAADLPSKKAAPASAVSVCKVGDATGFTLPGSETCVTIGGRVRFNAKFNGDADSEDGKLDFTTFGGYGRFDIAAATNTEIGVVRSFVRLANKGGEQYYIQVGGLTAGKAGSIADFLPTNSITFTRAGAGDTDGISYSLAAGGFTVAVAAETALAGNADRPDLLTSITGDVGPISLGVVGVSHQVVDTVNKKDDTGYAFLGYAKASLDAASIYAFGGTAQNATAYTGGQSYGGSDLISDSVADSSDSSLIGAGATYTLGKTVVGLEYAQYESKNSANKVETTEWAGFVKQTLAKGLFVQAEYTTYEEDKGSASVDGNGVYLRIQRDF